MADKKVANQIEASLEPKMLPSRFRERTAYSQRLYVFAILFMYSFAIGVMTFTQLGGLATKVNTLFNENQNYLVLTSILSIASLGTAIIAPISGKNRENLYTTSEFIISILPPILFIGTFLYLRSNFDYDNAKAFLFVLAIATMAINLIPVIVNFIKVILGRKRFKKSFIKSILMLPGTIVLGLPMAALWMMTPADGALNFETNQFLIPMMALGLGIVLVIIALVLSANKGGVKRSVWSSVKLSGILISMTTFTVFLAVSVRFMSKEISTTVLLSALVDILLLIGISTYAFFRGRIKNLNVTKPIFNNIILKGFVILTSVFALIFILLIDRISFMKDYAPPSYSILALSSLTILIGAFVAHTSKMVIYTKTYKGTVVGAFTTLTITLIVVISITVLKNSDIIVAIIARQLVTIFLVISIFFEIIILFIDIALTVANILNKSRLDSRKNKEKGKDK